MKKILIITYYWPPSGGAGVQRALKFVKYLPEFNIEPIVLTVDESRASYPVLDESLLNDIPKDVKVYKTNSFEPLKILAKVASKKAIPYGGFSGQNKEKLSQRLLRFIRGNFFIPDARVGWVKYAYKEACRIIEKENIDTILISTPPHSSQLIGLKLKKKYPHLKWIADLRDPWTDIYYYKEMMHTAMAKEKDARYEQETLDKANAIIVIGNGIKDRLMTKTAKPIEGKFHIIPNGFDAADFPSNVEQEKDKFLITYVGTISDIYAPQVFFEALKKTIDKFPNDKITFRFIGTISPAISDAIESFHLKEYCEFMPHVPHEEAVRYMLKSTVLLLVIAQNQFDKTFLSGKIFEYLNSRNTIIGIGPSDGEASAILKECNAGKMFDRTQLQELTDYLETLVIVWKSNTLKSLISENINKYSRKAQAEQLAYIIHGLE